ncbi:cytochrome P450 [Aspergillus pseudoustus]|uniref:Cytochrome P450 n=1 Tax=Aspergillus pseudoustus TaxID=1810923 RepID=A0ABR4J1V4_9EURO
MASFLGTWLVLVVCTLGIQLYAVLNGNQKARVIVPSLLLSEIAAFLWWLFYWVVLYPSYVTPFRHLPTPADRSLLTGNFDEFFPSSPVDTVRAVCKSVPNNGLIRIYGTLSNEAVLATSPEALRDIFSTNAWAFDRPPLFKLLIKKFTGSDFEFTADEVKLHRKSLMPAFTAQHMREVAPLFWQKTIEMIHGIESEIQISPSSAISISNWASRVALDNIGVAGMRHDVGAVRSTDSMIHRHYSAISSKPNAFVNWIVLLSEYVGLGLLLNLPLCQNSEIQAGARYVRSVAEQVIRERKDKLHGAESGGQSKDIITVALASNALSAEHLVEWIMILMAAGHETTAMMLEWTVYELGTRPEMQKRVREEVRAHSESLGALDASQLERLAYLNAFCKEVLRCHPFAPLSRRVATQDTIICGEHIPKGTHVAYSTMLVNFDEALWGPDAGSFNPERWMQPGMANTGGATSNYAMMTFSAGPRNCLGQAFARFELLCVVAALVGRFDIQLVDPVKASAVEVGHVARSKYGVRARLRILDGW